MALSPWMVSQSSSNTSRFSTHESPATGDDGMLRRGARISLICAAFALSAATLAQAADKRAGAIEDYPSKPVRFISPFSAGGGTDALARTLSQRAGESIGRVFVVD